ncbi:MAG: radical SAM protein [Candidatus Thorarchaeota archaeon]|nr:radical SAM protein [Candidatus Thorarchaeota archaeon]
MASVEQVRLSLGTAIQMGLVDGTKDPDFTTAFFMTYYKGRCVANCAFCPQARESSSHSDLLARIAWPVYQFSDALDRLRTTEGFLRICIQCVNYPHFVDDVEFMVRRIREVSSVPLSAATGPVTRDEMHRLKDAGVDNIGIALDASSPELFSQIKGEGRRAPFHWDSHIASLKEALEIFGSGSVTTHLIIGLGESEGEALGFLKTMLDLGVSVGLFAFTPIRGTALEKRPQPPISTYRRVQVARYLLFNGLLPASKILIDDRGRITVDASPDWLRETLSSGAAFRTSGCVGCNRPYYNERPRGPLYNYHRPLEGVEVEEALEETELV